MEIALCDVFHSCRHIVFQRMAEWDNRSRKPSQFFFSPLVLNRVLRFLRPSIITVPLNTVRYTANTIEFGLTDILLLFWNILIIIYHQKKLPKSMLFYLPFSWLLWQLFQKVSNLNQRIYCIYVITLLKYRKINNSF